MSLMRQALRRNAWLLQLLNMRNMCRNTWIPNDGAPSIPSVTQQQIRRPKSFNRQQHANVRRKKEKRVRTCHFFFFFACSTHPHKKHSWLWMCNFFSAPVFNSREQFSVPSLVSGGSFWEISARRLFTRIILSINRGRLQMEDFITSQENLSLSEARSNTFWF